MNDCIEIMDECLQYSINFDPSHFIYFYFDKSEITIYDMYIIDKIRLLRTDFINFWFSLDNNNKIRFVSMVTNYNSVYPQIKIPNNIILF
jgi:hypothetical protein